jgi:thiazole synthase ThiGH ThiG subunit
MGPVMKEYRTAVFNPNVDGDLESLNTLAAEGWSVVSYLGSDNFLLEREYEA